MLFWKQYYFHQKPHHPPNLLHHSNVSKRRVVRYLTLVHTESRTFGAADKHEGALICNVVIFTVQTKTFPVINLIEITLSTLFEGNTCLWRGGGCNGGKQGSGGACCSLRLARWQGTRYHHRVLLQQLPTHRRFSPRVDPGPGKAMVLVQHDQQPGHFTLRGCGQRLLGVKRITLHFKLLYLKLCQVLDAYQVFTAACGVRHFFWRHFKVVSPVTDLLTLSRSGQDPFCFHWRGERTRQCQRFLLHLISPPCFPLKHIYKLFFMSIQLEWGNPGAGTCFLFAYSVETSILTSDLL